jgi:hypothetical protein
MVTNNQLRSVIIAFLQEELRQLEDLCCCTVKVDQSKKM